MTIVFIGSHLIKIDFTKEKAQSFAQITDELINLCKQASSPTILEVIDWGYPLSKASYQPKQLAPVHGHINLTTSNPFIDSPERDFFPVEGIYQVSSEIPSALAANIELGRKPSQEEHKILAASGVGFYCYNLGLVCLVAARYGLSVKAFLRVDDETRL